MKVLITGNRRRQGSGCPSIHQRSGRASGPLLTVNCAGLPDSLLESELFGHVAAALRALPRQAGPAQMAERHRLPR
jgi:transcriptional regulator with GAF, ATPase, and Fis domain